MTDDAIRSLLTSVDPSPFVDRTPGTVALLRSRVEAAGGEHDAVRRWVEERGGRVDRTISYRKKGEGPRWSQKVHEGEEFYVVPTEALTP